MSTKAPRQEPPRLHELAFELYEFAGVVVSDLRGMAAATFSPPEKHQLTVLAGCLAALITAMDGKPDADLSSIGSQWHVPAEDYNRLLVAARRLRSACKDRLPPGYYAKLDDECRALDAVLKPAS
jgi:hypothetical protein